MKPTQCKIESIKKNIFYRSHDAITDYSTFDWHIYQKEIDTDKINSSQALAIDFWGCLKLSSFKNQIINHIFDKKCDSWDIVFEYEDKSILNEIKSTQVDILLESKTSAIFIESKFTEQDGGGCSQINKTKNGHLQCNGNYEEQTNPVNNIKSFCALSGKGIRYWDHIDMLTCFHKKETYKPCPIKKGEFQWIRNICFAQAFAQKNDKDTETFLVYFKSKKCPISKKVEKQSYLGKLKGNLNNPNAFRPISYNELLDKIIFFMESQDKNEMQVWMELKDWMEKKEHNR